MPGSGLFFEAEEEFCSAGFSSDLFSDDPELHAAAASITNAVVGQIPHLAKNFPIEFKLASILAFGLQEQARCTPKLLRVGAKELLVPSRKSAKAGGMITWVTRGLLAHGGNRSRWESR